MKSNKKINLILADPTVSFWLKGAIQALLQRDIVDAAADAEFLSKIMNERAREVLYDVDAESNNERVLGTFQKFTPVMLRTSRIWWNMKGNFKFYLYHEAARWIKKLFKGAMDYARR